MLTIGKTVLFGSSGQAVAGQTLPDSPNWRLRWFSHGQETGLYKGSYALCRRMQDACQGLGTLEEIQRVVDKLAAQVGVSGPFHLASTQPTEIYPAVADPENDTAELADEAESGVESETDTDITLDKQLASAIQTDAGDDEEDTGPEAEDDNAAPQAPNPRRRRRRR